MSHINTLQKLMAKSSLDLVYIDDPLIVSYFTELESDPHERVLAVFITQSDWWLLVPHLEKTEAEKISGGKPVLTYRDEQSPWEIVNNHLIESNLSLQSIGTIENNLTVSRYHALSDLFCDGQFTDITSSIQQMMVIKTEDEIEKMIKAGSFADRALEIGMKALKNDITESEVVAVIEYEMKKIGISQMSFSTMVLFGDHAASPHGTPGNRKLKPNELVLFDLGVIFEGYTSDVTRTVSYGKVSEKIKTIYAVVKEAQEKAQRAVKEGITAGEIDAVSRNCISDYGYGDYFTHRLGHGLGKSVHEFPNIAPKVSVPLKPGMCFSIEPGIYIENLAGIRIEDCIYVNESGAVPFTQTSKELIELTVKN